MALRTRLARLDDGEQLLAWRNHASSREQSLNTHIISLETHLAWLAATLADPQALLLLAEYDCLPAGQLRLNREADQRYFLSWSIAPEHQGQGIGKTLLRAFCGATAMRLHARIKPTNPASQRIAEAAGFELSATDSGWDTWQRNPISQQGPSASPIFKPLHRR